LVGWQAESTKGMLSLWLCGTQIQRAFDLAKTVQVE